MVRKTAAIFGLILLLFFIPTASAWYDATYLNATFLATSATTGIFSVNVSNATGTNNATYVFTNGHSVSNNFSDLVVVLDNTTSNIAYWFDNDTSQSNGNIIVWINKTASGVVGMYYNKAGATSTRNLSAVMPYADGWNGFWNYSYTGDGTWAVQPNGTYMQTDSSATETKKRWILSTFPNTYQVTAKLRIFTGTDVPPNNGKFGVVLGNDGANDIESVTRDSAGTTKHDILQYGVGWGTPQGTHYQSLVAGKWLMWDGITTGTAQQGRTYQVNDIQVNWQSGGAFTTSTNKRIGIAAGAKQVNEYQYWYAWNSSKISLGSWGAESGNSDAITILSWGNNYTNNQDLSLSVPQGTIINFNITNNSVAANYYNTTVNGIDQSNNFNNFTLTAPSLAGYTVTLSATNLTTPSTASKTWIVSVTPPSWTGGEGQITNDTIFMLGNGANITVLATQNFTQINLFNSSETPKNTLQFLINGSKIRLNSSTDKTVSNISYYPQEINSSRGWNFTWNAGSGYANITTELPVPLMNYSIYRNGTTWVARASTNTSGWLSYNITGEGNYSIQRDSGIPYLITPANNSDLATTEIDFTWSNESSAQYNIQVARDSVFTIIDADNNIATNSTSIEVLFLTNYYWRVRTYDGVATYGEWSELFTFEATTYSLPASDGSTGIHGYVFETTSAGTSRIANAIISLQNLTHFFQTTTDSNGYYRFTNLANESDYLLQAAKKNYVDSAIIPVQTINGTWKVQNIFMQACVSSYTCNVNQHFVKFTVQTLFGTKYPNVAATVYKSGETTVSDSAVTDDTGSANFWLVKDQKYRLTFINATTGINREITIVASDTEYLVIISGTGSAWQEYSTQRKDAVFTNVTKAAINSTHAYINTTYLDLLNETTALIIYINQTNASDPYNQTIIQSWTASGAMNDTNHSFVITPYSGQQYIVHYLFTHTIYGTNAYLSVSFTKSIIPSGISPRLLLWFAIIFMVITGAVFTNSTAELGLIVVAAEGWIFLAFGFLQSLNTTQTEIGLTVATVLGVISYITMKNKKEGYS